VIVVDDFSQDQTFTLLGLLREQNSRLRLSSLNQETRHSSKQSLNIAFKAAKNDWVILLKPSMADIPEGWFESFAEQINPEINLIAGYTNVKANESWKNKIYRIEKFYQQFQSFAFILARVPFVVEEDNLCVLKQKYFDIGGFAGQMNEEYANFELLANRFITKKNTRLNFSPSSMIRTDSQITSSKLGELYRKYVRVIHKLGFKRQFALAIDDLSRMLILPLTIVTFALFYKVFIVPTILVLIKIVLHIIIIRKAQKRLSEPKIFLSSLMYEMVVPYYRLIIRWEYCRSIRRRKWNN
jgi:glycosyltransferase involved in cell wall biosynthesis